MTEQSKLPPPEDKAERAGAWFGFDLDATLAEYEPRNFDPLVVGAPIAAMVKAAKDHMRDGYEVRIITARVSKDDERDPDYDVEAVREAIQDWAEEHLGKRVKVTNEVDYKMVRFYNDRATQVIPNTGITMGQLVAALRRTLDRYDANPEYAPEVEEHLEAEDKL